MLLPNPRACSAAQIPSAKATCASSQRPITSYGGDDAESRLDRLDLSRFLTLLYQRANLNHFEERYVTFGLLQEIGHADAHLVSLKIRPKILTAVEKAVFHLEYEFVVGRFQELCHVFPFLTIEDLANFRDYPVDLDASCESGFIINDNKGRRVLPPDKKQTRFGGFLLWTQVEINHFKTRLSRVGCFHGLLQLVTFLQKRLDRFRTAQPRGHAGTPGTLTRGIQNPYGNMIFL
jgi:hypothetical protein